MSRHTCCNKIRISNNSRWKLNKCTYLPNSVRLLIEQLYIIRAHFYNCRGYYYGEYVYFLLAMFHNAFGTDKSLDNLFGDLVFEVCIFLIQKFSMFLSYESFLKKTRLLFSVSWEFLLNQNFQWLFLLFTASTAFSSELVLSFTTILKYS